MPRAGKFLSRGLWEQPGPTTCISSVHLFSHWITGPLTASASRGEGAPPRAGGSPLPANKATGFQQGALWPLPEHKPRPATAKIFIGNPTPSLLPPHALSLLGGWQQAASGRRSPVLGPLALSLYRPRLQSPAGWPEEPSAP